MKKDLKNNRVTDLQVAYIGGGSRGWAWGFMKDLAKDGQICGTIRLYDIDHSSARRCAHRPRWTDVRGSSWS